MNYLAYLVYGGDDYNNEALYSMLSYFKYHTETENQIIIYTDDAAFFKQYLPANVIYCEINNAILNEWKGATRYIHRVKVKLLQDIIANYQGNILYVDTDTVFLGNVAGLFTQIAAGNIVFDQCEGRLADKPGGIAKKLRAFFKKENTFRIASYNEEIIFDADFAVWNSGAIGFNANFAAQLHLVEELVDVLYSTYPLFIMEQVAFSAFFQKANKPVAAAPYLHHYWYFKEFRPVLKHFFEHNKGKSFTQLQGEMHKVNPEQLSAGKRAYKKLTFWQRVVRKITMGKRWQMPEYKL